MKIKVRRRSVRKCADRFAGLTHIWQTCRVDAYEIENLTIPLHCLDVHQLGDSRNVAINHGMSAQPEIQI